MNLDRVDLTLFDHGPVGLTDFHDLLRVLERFFPEHEFQVQQLRPLRVANGCGKLIFELTIAKREEPAQ